MPECLNCDKFFSLHIESAQIKPEYCSEQCQVEFEGELNSAIEQSKKLGLIDENGESILQSGFKDKQLVTEVLKQYSTKIQTKDS